KCCTILLLPVATKLPCDITAAASGALKAQTPKPPKAKINRKIPNITWYLTDLGTSSYHSGGSAIRMALGIGIGLSGGWQVGAALALRQLFEHLPTLAKQGDIAVGQQHDFADRSQKRRFLGDDDD